MTNFTERDRITLFSSNHTSSYTCLIMQHMYMDRDTDPQRNTRSASCSPYEKWETQTIAKEANRTTHNCDLLQLHQYTNTCRAKTWLSCPFLFICRDYVYVCERIITAYDDSLWALGEWSEWARVCVLCVGMCDETRRLMLCICCLLLSSYVFSFNIKRGRKKQSMRMDNLTNVRTYVGTNKETTHIVY